MSTTGWVATIIIILIIIGGGWWYFAAQAPAMPAQTETTAVVNSDTGAVASSTDGSVAPLTQTIHFTASGFTPKDVTVANGGTVTWVNDSTGQMWIASDEHPTHTDYDSTSRTTHCAAGYTGPTPFDECGNGSSYSFTFGKAGTYSFHNHLAAQFEGTVTVEAAQ
jgi:plastocyanin